LQAALISNQLLLSWPAAYTNYVLEYATNLNPPIQWATNATPAVVVGAQCIVTNPVDASSRFFRLKK
jgi:hypothetical protein